MRTIKFIHITKCAGTSIENCAIKKGIEFGIFHKEYGNHHEIFVNKPTALKSKYDWFLVVRNPYERVLSEYYCKWGGLGNMDGFLSRDEFNDYLIFRIKHMRPGGGHYTQQYKYIDNNANIHVLKFENIKEEFDGLMMKYNIDLKLDQWDNCCNNKMYTVDDFSFELIQLINQIYDKDFQMFGYDKKII
jgi:hypothetical protein